MLPKKIIPLIVSFGVGLSLISCQNFGSVPILAMGDVPDSTVTDTPFQANSPTPQPTFTATLTVTPSPTPIPSPTPLPCRAESGRVETFQIATQDDPTFNFRIYFPPCFNQPSSVRYPVLYLIHGQTFNDDQWPRLGVQAAADQLIQSGKTPPFLVVMPREKDTFSDIYAASFSRDVISGLIPWVDAKYPTCTERACRAIGGLSRGGAWALHLGLTQWRFFGEIGLHSTPPFQSDPTFVPIWLRDIPTGQRPRIYMDIGKNDPFLSYASQLDKLLTALNIPHEWNVFDGTHEEAYWSAHIVEYLEWYSQPWQDMFQTILAQ